jgi:hypothetical protein
MDRKHDIELIQQTLSKPGVTPEQRAKLKDQLNKIANESSKVKSMREALIKAHQNGNVEELNDIRDFVNRRNDYQNS